MMQRIVFLYQFGACDHNIRIRPQDETRLYQTRSSIRKLLCVSTSPLDFATNLFLHFFDILLTTPAC